MAQVKLNDKQYDKKDCLEITIGEGKYMMPLANCMPLKTLKKLNKDADVDVILEVLNAYIPEEITDELTVADVKQIFEAWGAASKENSGIDLGK